MAEIWMDWCPTSGGQSRVRALIDWYLGVLEQSLASWSNVVLVNRLRWSGIYSSLLPVSSERKSFFCEASVVTLDWPRLASIICPSIFSKSIDVSRDTRATMIQRGFGFLNLFLFFFSIDKFFFNIHSSLGYCWSFLVSLFSFRIAIVSFFVSFRFMLRERVFLIRMLDRY